MGSAASHPSETTPSGPSAQQSLGPSAAPDLAQVCGPPGAQLYNRGSGSSGPHKLFPAGENLQDKLVAVIVTISEGQSYDEMFSTVKPTTVAGERVSTYAVGCGDVAQMHQLLSSAAPPTAGWRSLVDDVRSVPADSVVFNWECCAGCGKHAFPRSEQAAGASETMRFLGFLLRSGWTAMCSDFSLKSLIFEWSEEELGPKPFVQLGGCSGQLLLEFAPAELQHEEVPQQLQVLGDLCGDRGKAVVQAMGDTIVYSVDPRRTPSDRYDLKVLTVVTDGVQVAEDLKCSVGGGLRRGAAGHVTLTYKEGGQLVTSNGHWIELSRIDVSLESVERAAARNFGGAELSSFNTEYAQAATEEDRRECVQRRSHLLVQQSAPCRMKARTKFG